MKNYQQFAYEFIEWLLIYHIILGSVTMVQCSHREHKVHNIVLYPDKHSWCKTLPIKQVISYPGCTSKEIDNNVCVGACFSYSIPHTKPSDPSEVIVPYCDSCQPSETTWQHVTLGCSGNKNNVEMVPSHLVKSVEIIINCSCSSCDTMNAKRHSIEDDDLLLHYNDVPDLINMLQIRNETNGTLAMDRTEHMLKDIMNHKIFALLQSIQENNSQNDKMQLMELLQVVQGPEQQLSEQTIANFVDSLNSEHIELDIPKLKEILLKFEHTKQYEKHWKYATNSVDDNGSGNKLSTTTENVYQINMNDGELDRIIDNDRTNINNIGIADKHNSYEQKQLQHNHHHHLHHNHNNHHHAVGENFGHGHLTKGPRGALVIEPSDINDVSGSGINSGSSTSSSSSSKSINSIHEKLVVNPNELKLNHAGTFLSYGSDFNEKQKEIDE